VNDPDRYLPQYDGFCALGIAEKHKAEAGPNCFTIRDGKLLLTGGSSAQAEWLQSVHDHISAADRECTAASQDPHVD